jgi:hypothetical protein
MDLGDQWMLDHLQSKDSQPQQSCLTDPSIGVGRHRLSTMVSEVGRLAMRFRTFHQAYKWRTDFLPPNILSFLHQHVLHPHAPIQILKRQAVVNSQKAVNILYPVAMPLIDRVMGIVQSSNDYVVLIFVVAVLFILWQIVTSITRLISWWAGIAFRLLLWAAVAGLAAVVYQRGIDATISDLSWFYGVAAAVSLYVRDVVLHFWNTYEMQSQANAGRQHGSRKSYGRSKGKGLR